jgi:hypothetical protein
VLSIFQQKEMSIWLKGGLAGESDRVWHLIVKYLQKYEAMVQAIIL